MQINVIGELLAIVLILVIIIIVGYLIYDHLDKNDSSNQYQKLPEGFVCPNCGKKLSSEGYFCSHCGYKKNIR